MCLDKNVSVIEVAHWACVGGGRFEVQVYFVPDKSNMQSLIRISITGFCWALPVFEARSSATVPLVNTGIWYMHDFPNSQLTAINCEHYIMQWPENIFTEQCFSFQLYGFHPAWSSIMHKIGSELWDGCEHKTDILSEISLSWCLLPTPSHSLMLI